MSLLAPLRISRPRTAARSAPLLFLHVPKTAGTSLRHSLSNAYAPHERAFVYDPAELPGAVDKRHFPSLPLEVRAGLRLVMGHFSYGLHESLPVPSAYATMLREPLDRIISVYYHYLRHRAPAEESHAAALHRSTKGSARAIEEWVFDGRVAEVDNVMVRLIVGGHVPFGQCTDQMLSQAIEHMDAHFDAVLLQARMRTSLDVLSHVIGRTLRHPRNRNKTPGRPPMSRLDPAVALRLRELNRYDGELYRIAVERFERDVRRLAAAS